MSSAIVTNAPSLADTRASISKYFPMGSIMGSGKNSPISLHSVHPLLFAAVWSLIGETLVAQGFLERPVCEKIAKQVSMSNKCPICVTAHAMMEAAATKAAKEERDRRRREQKQRKKNGGSVEESSNASSSGNASGSVSVLTMEDEANRAALEADAIEYSKILHKATQVSIILEEDKNNNENETPSDGSSAPATLDERAKAEVAIVVFLFEHMNRVVSVIMGETMSTAMFGVPEAIGAPMESPSFMARMNKFIMGPFLKGYFRKDRTPKSGFTTKLFDSEGASQNKYDLPTNLQGAKEAGPGGSQAVARWAAVVDAMEKEEPISTLLGDDGLTKIATIREDLKKACLRSRTATAHLADCVKDVEDEKQRATLLVILLTSCVPGLSNKSAEWKEARKVLGDETARLLVVWWSMKLSMEQAKGLE